MSGWGYGKAVSNPALAQDGAADDGNGLRRYLGRLFIGQKDGSGGNVCQ